MAPALSTTKRKFHRILDSISNASSTSLTLAHKNNSSTTTLPATLEPPAKRTKLARPTSNYVNSTTRLTASPAPGARVAAAAKHPPSTTPNKKRNAPNFAPWDRAQFLGRLKTYRPVDKWTTKPDKINEIQWAKRGWSCVGKDTVECVGGCGARVVITLRDTSSEKENYETQSPDDETGQEGWRQRAQEDLIEKYTLIIATAHDTGCLWQKKGSDRMVQRLALAHPATAITGLRERYESLVAIADKLPLHPSPPKDFDFVSLQTLVAPLLLKSIAKPSTPSNSQAPSDAMDPPTEPAASSTESPNIPTNYTQPSINRAALIFAFFGWQATEPGPRSGMAKCEACFRTLGLWLYKPSSPSATPVIDCLYVAGEHRDYCPWVNPISQSGVVSSTSALDTDSVLEGLAGWEVLVKVVLAELMRRKREDEPTGPMRVQEVSDDAVSEVADIPNLATPQEDRAKIEKKDKDLMAKLKRVAQKFRIGKGKKGPSAGPSSGGAVA